MYQNYVVYLSQDVLSLRVVIYHQHQLYPRVRYVPTIQSNLEIIGLHIRYTVKPDNKKTHYKKYSVYEDDFGQELILSC